MNGPGADLLVIAPTHLLGDVNTIWYELRPVQVLLHEVPVNLSQLGLGLVYPQPLEDGSREFGIGGLA